MSGANEKAQLKGTFSKYLIGVALIVMCTLVASTVAGIANADGRNDADGVVDSSFGLGGMKVGTTVAPSKPTTKNVKSKLAVTGTDGANVEIRYKDGKKTTDSALPYEISQYVDGKVPAGTEIQLVAEAKSEHGKEFDCWAIVDDDGNIITVLSYDNLLDYVMPEENVNIQAIYKEHVVAKLPEDTESRTGEGAAKLKIKEGESTPVAVVIASYKGTDDSAYTIEFKNWIRDDKFIRESSKGIATDPDSTLEGHAYGLASSASTGKYEISITTQQGYQPPQKLSIICYDKDGKRIDDGSSDLQIYTKDELNDILYDSEGNEVEPPNVPYAISYPKYNEMVVVGDLDIVNYSYRVNVDCLEYLGQG